MKVLFVSSGNNIDGISSIVFNQGESLRENGVEIEYYTIKGKGLLGYLKNIHSIKKKVKSANYDLIHAHYSLSALTATLSFPKIPIIVSLMGSDSKMNLFWNLIIKINYYFFWKQVIVKSEEMQNGLKLDKCSVIPNGVDLNNFILKNKAELRKKLGFSKEKKYILFLSNPERVEKNYNLASEAAKSLSNNNVELVVVYNKTQTEVIEYLNACDILLLTSLWEGSPNALKEAMACNLPIVSTNVGDVEWLFGNESGHYLTSYNPNEVAENIKVALEFSEKYDHTKGRQRIIDLGLDSQTAAKKIINVYKKVLN